MKRYTVSVAVGKGKVERYEWEADSARTALAWTRQEFPKQPCCITKVEDIPTPYEPVLLLACDLAPFYGSIPVAPTSQALKA